MRATFANGKVRSRVSTGMTPSRIAAHGGQRQEIRHGTGLPAGGSLFLNSPPRPATLDSLAFRRVCRENRQEHQLYVLE